MAERREHLAHVLLGRTDVARDEPVFHHLHFPDRRRHDYLGAGVRPLPKVAQVRGRVETR
jgi:hypothetical protein